MAASTLFTVCWPSVTVRCGTRVIVSRKIVMAECTDTFGEVLVKVDRSFAGRAVEKVVASKNERFIDPVHEVPLIAPAVLCEQYGNNLCYYLMEQESTALTSRSDLRNAFDVLMSSQRERLPPSKISPKPGGELRGDFKLRNAVVDVLTNMNVGWSPDSVKTIGEEYVKQVSAALWYLDPHHERLSSRSVHLPLQFRSLPSFNDWQRKKVKQPLLTSAGLQDHIQNLSQTMLQPWMAKSEYTQLRQVTGELVEAVLEVRTLEPCADFPTAKYAQLCEVLSDKDHYDAISLNDIAPEDRYERRHWMDGLRLPYGTMVYRCPYGNNMGVLSFIWKIPSVDEVDQTKVARLVTKLSEDRKFYASREMRRDFLDRYHRLTSSNKSVLRNIYKKLTGDSSVASSEAEKAVDDRVAQAICEPDDPEVIYDLRKLNGKPKSTTFDHFWDELGTYIEELTPAVDERRHSDTPHMPVAISLRHLRSTILDRLQKKHEGDESKMQAPSLEWLRLQFWPRNVYSSSALRHTGRVNLKFGVQVRQLRHSHTDSRYVSMILRYLKHFCVESKQYVRYVSVDDKAIIPVGEPGMPVSTGVRGHNRSIVLAEGPHPSALDHDFHVHGIVPSVSFVVDIPESPKDSFYNGKAFVCLKDKVCQPSSPIRHSVELSKLIKSKFCGDGKTILVVVSDGGPDHRITYASVQVALVCLFQSLDLDMLVCARTCPYQSWQNIAERIMSTLNLALMNVSLCRKELPPELEPLLRNKKTLTDVRAVIDQNPSVGVALIDAMQGVITTLSSRFMSMEIKGEQIGVESAASDTELSELFELIHFIEPGLSSDKITKDTIMKGEHIHKFMKSHCSSTTYIFQVKKCMDPGCYYCLEYPVKMPMEEFMKLSFIPLPLMTEDGQKYKEFKDMYGKEPDESGRPSLKPGSLIDKERKDLLVSAKVRCVLNCQECFKPRCIYSKSKLSLQEKLHIEAIQESRLFTCGSAIFPPNSPLSATICARESITCSDPMELQYFSATLVHFPPVCYWCGTGEETLIRDSIYTEKEQNFQIVHAICMFCRSEGKLEFTRHPFNAPKRKKT